MNTKVTAVIILAILIIVCAGMYKSMSSGDTPMQAAPSMMSATSTDIMQEATSTGGAVMMKGTSTVSAVKPEKNTAAKADLAKLTDAEWKQRLTPDQYAVLRQSGTETPFTSPLLHETRAGTFVTADCGEPVFRSEAKFDSGTGWPSFYQPIKNSVIERTDASGGSERTEVVSVVCHSHLGHVFSDAPQTPTGLRYCINGLALIFIPDKK
jgi:peptide-methionine (R)-S-oxide reductase